jgi:hypothetical protein
MTKEEEAELLERILNANYHEPDDSVVVLRERTIEKPYGRIYFYQSKSYLELGDDSFMLAGNGPVVFMADGTRHHLGTARSPEAEIAEFERERGLR